jgi:uncharacterized protein YndB with AHSA1/START domain
MTRRSLTLPLSRSPPSPPPRDTARAMFRASLDIEIAAEIERPCEEVWAFVSNAERLPQWLNEFEAVVKESKGPVGRGTVFRYTVSPGHRSATIEVVEWEPGQRLAWDGHPLRSLGGGASPRGSFEVSAIDERRTRFVSRYQPELTGTLAIMRPYLARWLHKQRIADTSHLKQMLESRGEQ